MTVLEFGLARELEFQEACYFIVASVRTPGAPGRSRGLSLQLLHAFQVLLLLLVHLLLELGSAMRLPFLFRRAAAASSSLFF